MSSLRFGHLNNPKVSILSFLIIFSIFVIIDYLDWSLSNNAYFYTLSAISQTIAALVGFIGMFTIFRFQEIQSKKNQLSKELDRLGVKRLNNIDEIQKFGQDSFFDFFEMDNFSYDEWIIQLTNLCGKYIEDDKKDDFFRVTYELRKARRDTEYYKKTISFPILLGVIAMILSILFLSLGEIEVPENITSLSFSPLLIVGLVVSIAISFLIVIIFSFIDMLHRE